MGIARKIEAEMTEILRLIDGLGLAAQDDLVDEALMLGVLHLREDAVEMRGPQRAAFGKRDLDGAQEITQGFEPCERR